jgi:hypothetical protein
MRDSTCRFGWQLKATTHRKKLTGYLSGDRKCDWALRAFAASREPRSELQDVAGRHGGEGFCPSGTILPSDEIQGIRIEFPLTSHQIASFVIRESRGTNLVEIFDPRVDGQAERPTELSEGPSFRKGTK